MPGSCFEVSQGTRCPFSSPEISPNSLTLYEKLKGDASEAF